MIDKLEFFIALANEKHFGRAAEECGITQPTLSAAIRQLEEQLGVMLVVRGSRFQGLTPEGQRVLEWARRIVGDTRTMREEMKAARKGLAGHIRIAAIPTALAMIPARPAVVWRSAIAAGSSHIASVSSSLSTGSPAIHRAANGRMTK